MIVKVEKTSNYTVMSNTHLRDRNLSMKAKGLMSIVLSLPDNWEYSISGLAALSTEKESAVKSALNELKDHGYLVVTKKMPNDTKSGRIEYEYTFYETPEKAKQATEKQGVENLPLEILSVENQGQLNTNISNTNIVNTNSIDKPLISPTEKRKMLFKEFWDAYPKCKRKVDYDGCERAFIKIPELEKKFPDIMASLEIWKKDWSKDNFEYVPTTHKWIAKKYWEVKDMRTELQQRIDEATKKNIDGFIF